MAVLDIQKYIYIAWLLAAFRYAFKATKESITVNLNGFCQIPSYIC